MDPKLWRMASCLLALPLLLLEGAMLSSAPREPLDRLFRYIDLHQDEFVQTLKEWVAVESTVQPQPPFGQDIFRMMAMAADKLRSLGARVDSVDLDSQQLPDGERLPMPPVILAELGSDPKKATVCFYGHLDVQPAERSDGWLTDPYVLTEVDGKLYGRGATDNKGPVLAWINAVSAFRALEQLVFSSAHDVLMLLGLTRPGVPSCENKRVGSVPAMDAGRFVTCFHLTQKPACVERDLPVNIKFVLEGMEEVGSVSLEELVRKEKDHFFSSVDYIVISDNLWLSRTKPALTYGTRGDIYFFVEVKCRDQDFHSGTFGGILNEPMADLVALLGSLVDSSGHILIPGIYEQVDPLTEEERKLYETVDLDLEEYRNSTQVEKFLFDTKEELLMHLWRHPSLSIHGIEGAFDGPGIKTVIPGRVTGKFSIRLVPHMNISTIEKQVKQHLEAVFSERGSSNRMAVTVATATHPWLANIKATQYLAAKNAISTVFGTQPDMIRDGSTIPIARMFQEVIQKSVMMLPLGSVDDGEHSQNEKINRRNYIEGSKLFAAFFLEMAKLH